jgi:hypothetical protein
MPPRGLAAVLLLLPIEALTSWPAVQLKLSPTFDEWLCGAPTMALIPHWTAEAAQVLPAFQASWDEDAPKLLGGTVALVGAPFKSKGETATAMICPCGRS